VAVLCVGVVGRIGGGGCMFDFVGGSWVGFGRRRLYSASSFFYVSVYFPFLWFSVCLFCFEVEDDG
jgi:hypothetical protein